MKFRRIPTPGPRILTDAEVEDLITASPSISERLAAERAHARFLVGAEPIDIYEELSRFASHEGPDIYEELVRFTRTRDSTTSRK